MKKLTVFSLALALILSLSGCGIRFVSESYTQPEETLSPETYGSSDVAGLEPGIYYYLMEETVEDLTTNTTTRTEYIPGNDVPRIGLIVYENDVEIRREDWEVDPRNNITKNTVTENSTVTEVWEYELTYNALLKLDKKVCTLNGQWQITYDYVYATKKPFNLVRILVEQPGEELPPWYAFAYKNGRLVDIRELFSDTPEDYGKNGSSPRYRQEEFDENGELTNRRVSLGWEGGFLKTYYEKFDHQENHTTITRYDNSPNALMLRIEEYYDDAGNCILREEYSPEGELLLRITREYTSVTVS